MPVSAQPPEPEGSAAEVATRTERTSFHRLRIADLRRETPEMISIALAVPPQLGRIFAFRSGQHVTVRARLGGGELRRDYSICSGLDEGELRIAVKRHSGGLFSCFANEALMVGDVLDVTPPKGRFGIDPDPALARRLVGFAAGSGITPVISIIKTVLAREPRSRFGLFYGNRSSASICFRRELDDLKDRHVDRLALHHVLSREAQDVPLLQGRLTSDKVVALMRTLGEEAGSVDRFFLCGPLPMVREVRAGLDRLGVPRERVQVELFTANPGAGPPQLAAPAPADTAAATIALTVRIDGATHRLTMRGDETALEAALRQGLELPYSCRAGMCCTCRARLIEGEVAMDENFSLEPWEMRAGFVLTCQSRACSAAVTLDFDAM